MTKKELWDIDRVEVPIIPRTNIMKSLTTVLGVVSLAKLTWAHGYVDNATIGGVYYQVGHINQCAVKYQNTDQETVLSTLHRPLL